MTVKKKKLYETMDVSCEKYSDQYGFIGSVSIIVVIANDKQEKVNIFSSCIKDGEKFRKTTVKDICETKNIKLYIPPKPNNYGRQAKINEKNAVELVVESFELLICGENKKFKDIKELKKFLEMEVYLFSKGYTHENFALPDYEIREGDLVLAYNEKRKRKTTFKVTKLYPQPNKENLLCRLYSTYDKCGYCVECETRKIFCLPYNENPKPKNELLQFNESLQEDKLSPFWEGNDNEGNLYWQPIENACFYTVLLYKYRPIEKLKNKLYPIETFSIDRNTHWLTVKNLIGGKYVICVKAEDRLGNIIACSRGIKLKWDRGMSERTPEFWE